MPTYEYRCKDCGDDLEVVQSFSDDPLVTCPACGGTLKKVFGSVGISFKGSGFYKTDSRGSSSTSSSTTPSESSSSASSSSSDSSTSSGSSSSSGGESSTPAAKAAKKEAAPA